MPGEIAVKVGDNRIYSEVSDSSGITTQRIAIRWVSAQAVRRDGTPKLKVALVRNDLRGNPSGTAAPVLPATPDARWEVLRHNLP